MQPLLLLLLLACTAAVASSDDPAQRARAMLQQMTLDEKLTMCHGSPTKYTGEIAGNQRLSIPPLRMNDGPQGFRTDDAYKGTTTSWPSALTLAATFDTGLASEWGHAMGQEFRDKGAGMQLGPGVNVARLPECGRNFEYLSGEDPFLGRLMVAPVVKGIQAEGVVANVKHFVNNNQEYAPAATHSMASSPPSRVTSHLLPLRLTLAAPSPHACCCQVQPRHRQRRRRRAHGVGDLLPSLRCRR